jgi:hypothetical protein
MPNEFSQFAPYLFVALIIFLLYRRLRRSFGRQILSPARMTLRMVLFAVLAALLLPQALRSAAFAAAAAGGAGVGVLLGLWGASRTRFERAGARLYYVPHTYTGIAVSLLFTGRVIFRLLQMYQTTHVPGAGPPPGPPSGMSSFVTSPLTLGLFFVLVGYYVCYFGLVLWKSKHLKADEVVEIASPLGAQAGSAVPGTPASTLISS